MMEPEKSPGYLLLCDRDEVALALVVAAAPQKAYKRSATPGITKGIKDELYKIQVKSGLSESMEAEHRAKQSTSASD